MTYTYRSKFESELVDRIQGYGSLEMIFHWVDIYRWADPQGRAFEFREWLGERPFQCPICNSHFYPDPRETTEDDRIICKKCRKSGNCR